MRMKKKLYLIMLLIPLLLIPVVVVEAPGTGTIRIDPAFPLMSGTVANFEIWVQPGGDPTADPHIFLVMTEDSFNGLTGPVTVTWTSGSIAIDPSEHPPGPWHKETINSIKVPPDTTPGAGYTVASLKDHLGTTGPIYWAFASILDAADLTTTHVTIKVTLPSSSPRMLVYVLGKTSNPEPPDLFNNKVPPTIPGFMVPEIPLGTITALLSTLAALALFTARRPRIKR